MTDRLTAHVIDYRKVPMKRHFRRHLLRGDTVTRPSEMPEDGVTQPRVPEGDDEKTLSSAPSELPSPEAFNAWNQTAHSKSNVGSFRRSRKMRETPTPSEGVGKTAECLLLPKEFWDAVRAERRYSVYNGGRQISLLPKEWAKWGHTLLLRKE